MQSGTCAKLLSLCFLFGIAASHSAAEEATSTTFWDTFLTDVLGSIDETGRLDVASTFRCRANSDTTQICFDASSQTSFRFKREASDDVISIDVVLEASDDANADDAGIYAGVTVSGIDEFLDLRSSFDKLMRKHKGEDEDCNVKMSTELSSDDPTQFFSIRNHRTDTAIIVLFPNSGYEKAISVGINLDERKGKLIGTVLVINSLAVDCKTGT